MLFNCKFYMDLYSEKDKVTFMSKLGSAILLPLRTKPIKQ